MWFVNRENAEALLAASAPHQIPGLVYSVAPNGCGPGYGILVTNADGVITEAWDGESDLTQEVAEHDEEIRRLQRFVMLRRGHDDRPES